MPIALKNQVTSESIIKFGLLLSMALLLFFVALGPNSQGTQQFTGETLTFDHNVYICDIGREAIAWFKPESAN